MQKVAEEVQGKLSFFSKSPVSCPVCDTNVYREELRTGGGRLIASDLTSELRRKYEPSKKYGPVYPLIYPVMTCPNCYYSVFQKDFAFPEGELRTQLESDTERRKSTIVKIFDYL